MEAELTLEGKPGDMFAGRSIKRNCPTCGSKNKDQIWMEHRAVDVEQDQTSSEGVAWCPCGTIFYYSTTNRYESHLGQRVDLGLIEKVFHTGGKKGPRKK